MKRSLMKNLLQAQQAGLATALVTDLKTGQQSVVYQADGQGLLTDGDLGLSDVLLQEVSRSIEQREANLTAANDTEFFIQPY
ncbi:MAG: hypothetical protein AAF556_03990 [Pseudomonadota bacterium]